MAVVISMIKTVTQNESQCNQATTKPYQKNHKKKQNEKQKMKMVEYAKKFNWMFDTEGKYGNILISINTLLPRAQTSQP